MEASSLTSQSTVNLVVMGASGVGKSLIDMLLVDHVHRVDPYRARPSGARAGESLYVAPAMLAELLRLCKMLGPRIVPLDVQYDPDFGIYERASFFAIRGKMAQCLLHSQSPK